MAKRKESRLDVRLTAGGDHLLNQLAELLGIDKTDVVEIALRHYAKVWDLPLDGHKIEEGTTEVGYDDPYEEEEPYEHRGLPGTNYGNRLPGT